MCRIKALVAVNGERALRGVFDDSRFVRALWQICDDGAVPVDLMTPHAHRRVLEAVAEQAPFVAEQSRGLDELRGRGVGTIENEPRVFRPELSVPRHRLAIEAGRLGGVEEHVRHLVLNGRNSLIVWRVARHARVAVRAPIDFAEGAVARIWRGRSRPGLMQPARLRNAQAVRADVP